jgi:chromosome segregation ATPase
MFGIIEIEAEEGGQKVSISDDQLEAVSRQLESSQRERAGLKDQLGDEKIARHTAEQRSLDLGERLADPERHQASLEEKHRHARDALEHYRVASKEQREQENRPTNSRCRPCRPS